MTSTAADIDTEQPTGMEDVTRSVRALARKSRNLGTSAAHVAERELATAIRIAANVRDEVISKEMLDEARRSDLPARLRRDVHEAVDVAADAGSVLGIAVMRFFERLADERRPSIEGATDETVTSSSAGSSSGRKRSAR